MAEDNIDKTVFKVQTTNVYTKAGIASAKQNDISKPISIDWGDGTSESIYGDIHNLVHAYSGIDEYTVIVSNIKAFMANDLNDDAWTYTTS